MLLLKRFTQLVKTFFNFRHLTCSQFSYPVVGQREPAALTNTYSQWLIILIMRMWLSTAHTPGLLALSGCEGVGSRPI